LIIIQAQIKIPLKILSTWQTVNDEATQASAEKAMKLYGDFLIQYQDLLPEKTKIQLIKKVQNCIEMQSQREQTEQSLLQAEQVQRPLLLRKILEIKADFDPVLKRLLDTASIVIQPSDPIEIPEDVLCEPPKSETIPDSFAEIKEIDC